MRQIRKVDYTGPWDEKLHLSCDFSVWRDDIAEWATTFGHPFEICEGAIWGTRELREKRGIAVREAQNPLP